MSRISKIILCLALAAVAPASGQNAPRAWQSRKVTYTADDIITIATKIRYTTLVVLPASEKIVDFLVGDKDFWQVEGVQNFCSIKPSREGASSNVSLITASGNVYSFAVDEVSQSGRSPDLKVFVNLAGGAEPREPRFVSMDEHEQLRKDLVDVTRDAERTKEQFRQKYGQTLHFVYKFEQNRPPFNVSAIYHDGKFTYIQSNAPERPVLYELAADDGKPNLVNFDVDGGGLYVVHRVITRGQLAVGNKRMRFEIDRALAAASMLKAAGFK